MKDLFVTGIGTDVGKTIVSAVLVRALSALYWKPVQAGGSDESTVACLAGVDPKRCLPPVFNLTTACSPHKAAEIDGVRISLEHFRLPQRQERIIVEGAGGLLVPLNESDTVIDLISKLGLPVVVVSAQYLGSINHTLLSLEALRARSLGVKGVVFVGERNIEAERAILKIGNTGCLFRLPWFSELSEETLRKFVDENREEIHEEFK